MINYKDIEMIPLYSDYMFKKVFMENPKTAHCCSPFFNGFPIRAGEASPTYFFCLFSTARAAKLKIQQTKKYIIKITK